MSGILATGLPEEKPSQQSQPGGLFSMLFGKKEEKEEEEEEISDLSMNGTDLLSLLMALSK